MSRFYDSKYTSTDYASEIEQAKRDLEFDFPNSRVFICYVPGGSPMVRCRPISLLPPENFYNVITKHIELPGKFFGTEGYDCFVFSEGVLEYGGVLKAGWTTYSDGAQESSGSSGYKRLQWSRKDGSTKQRTKTTIDTANWMKELDGELYLSALTIPATHNAHALVGTPIMPGGDIPNPYKGLVDGIVDGWAKATKAAECQDWNIETQLMNGVRYFDFRYGMDLKMRHGQMELPGTLPQCLKTISDFLDRQPQETVIVMAKWDMYSFIKNDGMAEPATVLAAADKAFTDLKRFENVSSTPQLKNVRGKIIRKKEGNSTQGLDIEIDKRNSRYYKPFFSRPEYQMNARLSVDENAMLDRLHTLNGKWAKAERDLQWIKEVRRISKAEAVAEDNAETDASKKTHVANVSRIWDNTGLNDYHMDSWSVALRTTLFPVDFALPTNKQLHSWVEANCSLAQRYELGVIQLDFAGSEGKPLLTKLILTNFA